MSPTSTLGRQLLFLFLLFLKNGILEFWSEALIVSILKSSLNANRFVIKIFITIFGVK